MNRDDSITGPVPRGFYGGIAAARPSHTTTRIAALLVLAAFTVRLAGLFPGVPVYHGHGHVASDHGGGGYRHAYGPADARGSEDIPDGGGAPTCDGCFALSCLPALSGESAGPGDLPRLPTAGLTGPAGISEALQEADHIQSRAPPAGGPAGMPPLEVEVTPIPGRR